jgi:hypothetical protein
MRPTARIPFIGVLSSGKDHRHWPDLDQERPHFRGFFPLKSCGHFSLTAKFSIPKTGCHCYSGGHEKAK